MTGAGPSADDRPRRRPTRACTARTPARLAPPAPLPSRKVTSLKKFAAVKPSSEPFTPIVLSSPISPAQEERWQLRNMWELASVLHFLNVFRPVLKIVDDFTADELESALLMPNNRLGNIHIILLKAVPPVHRSPLNLETWVTILTKKLQNWWPWVAEGSCPLVPAHGQEMAAYKEFDPGTRLMILKALCEIRVDQDDVRTFIEQSLKQGQPVTNFRKERTGADMYGTTYWYFDDPSLGHRLCRDTRVEVKVKGRNRARDYPPPVAGQWETLATNFEEFQYVSEKLSASSHRLEIALGKKITAEVLPELEEMQKKKERTLKKQQRQAVLLDNLMQVNGLAAGRSRRDRKPVSYTFDDYDRSINEAIKFTKKREPSPEIGSQHGVRGAYDRSNGSNGHSGSIEMLHSAGMNGNHAPDAEGLANLSSRRRQLRKSQRYSESEYVHTIYDEAETSSDEEIEGEAIYDDTYLREKKRRKKAASSSEGEGDDEEYRGDEAEDGNLEDDDIEDSDEEDEDDDGFYSSGRGHQHRRLGKRKRKEHKLKSVDELQRGLQWGLRRSKRATKSAVDYSKYDESECEDEENAEMSMDDQGRDRSKNSPHDSDASSGPSDNSQGRRESDAESEDFPVVKINKQKLKDLHDRKGVSLSHLHDGKPVAARISVTGIGHQQHATSVMRAEHKNGAIQSAKASSLSDVKPHRFLDLNVAAPVGSGFEDTGGCSTHAYGERHGNEGSLQVKSSDEDDNYFVDGGRVDISGGYPSSRLNTGVALGGSMKRE